MSDPALHRFAAALQKNKHLWKPKRVMTVDGVVVGVDHHDTSSFPRGLPTPSLDRREYFLTWDGADGRPYCRKILRFVKGPRRYIVDQTWPQISYPTLRQAISRCLLNDFTVCT